MKAGREFKSKEGISRKQEDRIPNDAYGVGWKKVSQLVQRIYSRHMEKGSWGPTGEVTKVVLMSEASLLGHGDSA